MLSITEIGQRAKDASVQLSLLPAHRGAGGRNGQRVGGCGKTP